MMQTDIRSLRVALVYDRVNTPHGGAERVLHSLHQLFPQAPLFTSVYDKDQAHWADVFEVKPSFLQHIPMSKQKHRELLPLMPLAFSQFKLNEYDIVISVTSAEAKGITLGEKTLHVSYLLTPPRYLWSHTHEYQTGLFKPLKAFTFSLLRRWDYKVSQKVDALIPISNLVKKRAEKYYQRKIEDVIYPPFTFSIPHQMPATFHELKNYFLIVARLVSYKKVLETVQSCIQNKHQLVVIGDGPDAAQLSSYLQIADPKHTYIHWFTSVSNEELIAAYTNAKAVIQPAEEDFGITVLEAQASGTPVIVNKRSGAAETIVPQKTGILLQDASPLSLEKAISQIEQYKWDSSVIQSHVEQYNDEVFQRKFLEKITELWQHRHSMKGSYEQS